MYQGVRNICFSENRQYVLNEWSHNETIFLIFLIKIPNISSPSYPMKIFNACFLLRQILLFNGILLIRVVFLFPWYKSCYQLNQTRLNKGGQVRLLWFTLVNCDSLYRFNFFPITHAIVKPNYVFTQFIQSTHGLLLNLQYYFTAFFTFCFYWTEKYFAGGIINLLNAKTITI